jgi:hypothetical protein
MSKRLVVPLLVALLALPAVANGQTFLFIGGGPTFPSGEYSDYANTGWIAHAGIGFPVGPQGLMIGVDGFYGQNNHSDIDGDKTNPLGAMGFIAYRIGNPERPGIYLIGDAGLLVHKYGSDTYDSESESQFAFGGGAGVEIPLGGKKIWVEGHYTTSDGTNFISTLVGISFPL